MQVDHPLVDAHLEPVPGLGTFTTRGLTGGDAEDLGWHADGALEKRVIIVRNVLFESPQVFANYDLSCEDKNSLWSK